MLLKQPKLVPELMDSGATQPKLTQPTQPTNRDATKPATPARVRTITEVLLQNHDNYTKPKPQRPQKPRKYKTRNTTKVDNTTRKITDMFSHIGNKTNPYNPSAGGYRDNADSKACQAQVTEMGGETQPQLVQPTLAQDTEVTSPELIHSRLSIFHVQHSPDLAPTVTSNSIVQDNSLGGNFGGNPTD